MRLTALQSDAHGPSDLDRTGTTSSVAKRTLSEPFPGVATVEKNGAGSPSFSAWGAKNFRGQTRRFTTSVRRWNLSSRCALPLCSCVAAASCRFSMDSPRCFYPDVSLLLGCPLQFFYIYKPTWVTSRRVPRSSRPSARSATLWRRARPTSKVIFCGWGTGTRAWAGEESYMASGCGLECGEDRSTCFPFLFLLLSCLR